MSSRSPDQEINHNSNFFHEKIGSHHCVTAGKKILNKISQHLFIIYSHDFWGKKQLQQLPRVKYGEVFTLSPSKEEFSQMTKTKRKWRHQDTALKYRDTKKKKKEKPLDVTPRKPLRHRVNFILVSAKLGQKVCQNHLTSLAT